MDLKKFTSQDVTKARDFAIAAHGNQMYDKNLPYVYHLDSVVEILRSYNHTIKIIGYLHDTIEDTHITESDIKDIFGEFIAKCVFLLSDEPGKERKDRKLLTNKKQAAIGKDEYQIVLIVKAADRLANLKMGGKVDMYKEEHKAFELAVHREHLCPEIWNQIDDIIKEN